MDKLLKIAAMAWTGAKFNIMKFAKAFVDAVANYGDAARERFSKAYPMFGPREWRRLEQIGSGELLPDFFMKSDAFVGRLLRLNSSKRIQKALVEASELNVIRKGVTEKVLLSELTEREEKELMELLKDDGSNITPEKMRDRIHALVVNVNKSRGPISLRRPREILDDLVEAVRELEVRRDEEWEFAEKHGIGAICWTEKDSEDHDEIVAAVVDARKRVRDLCREATGDGNLEV